MTGEVELVFPVRGNDDSDGISRKSFLTEIRSETRDDIYGLVEEFRKGRFSELAEEDFSVSEARNPMALENVINLHDGDEIGVRVDIGEMVKRVESGREVLMTDGFPNVKVTKTKREELVLFDGHHTLLAYMMTGRSYLCQVPHLLVTDVGGAGFDDREILAFFGDHAEKLKGEDWREFTISWTKPEDEQLKSREYCDMGELLEGFSGS
ncbi:MAG: hypothetical protein ACOC49_02715 [Candidatus Bipolaricaulota bacterium]